jgi:transcriptional regulator with XRE-family HTH domain
MNSTRLDSLQEFKKAVLSADLESSTAFRSLLNQAQALLEMNDQEIGDSLRVSRPTVNRWMRGKSLPHRALRKPIAEWVLQQLTVKIKRLEAIRAPAVVA